MTANSKNSVRVAVISTEGQVAENVVRMLNSSGIASERYETTADWASHAKGGSESTSSASMNGNGGDCVLLVGEVGSLIDRAEASEIQAKLPGTPVVVVSTDMNIENAVAVMRQGASDVVPLPCPQERLSAAVRRASETGREQRQVRKRRQTLRERLASLTRAEQQVLDAMLEGLANRQIATSLKIGLRTVELRRSKIMRKMEAKSLAQLVRLVCEADPNATGVPAETA
jgi:FixJ family two-component response regulator